MHEPFLELDGALVRIRVPGGLLPVDAARAIARAVAMVNAGAIEITNRANLQLRGVPSSLVGDVGDALTAAGVARPDPAADERRNVLASPMAGVDPTELVDTRELVTAIDELLASDSSAGLAPKFGVVVDGGGAVHTRGRALDVAVGALQLEDGTVRYDVRLGEALPLAYDRDDALHICEPDAVLRVIAATIETCRPFGRARPLLDAWGRTRAWNEICDRAPGVLVTTAPPATAHAWPGPSAPVVGVHPQRQPGLVAVGAGARLGRLDATTLLAAAELADGALRISPARALIVTDVPEADASAVVAELDALGLVTDPDHPANAVVACVGSRGCASGFVDTLADADQLIDALAALPVQSRPESVHVSGCEKGCAHPGLTEWTLVGGPERDTYTARRDDAEIARGVRGTSAIALVTDGTVRR